MKPYNFSMQDVWAVEQSILDQIANFCDEKGLRYSLAYGTLLGAVRHKGFIPWDDDVDIMMPREDYDRLMQLWSNAAPQGLVLDRCDLDPDNRNTFAKVRKDHTTFLQSRFEIGAAHHKGVFNDIFPGDHVPKGKLRQTLQYADFALMLLFNRGHTSGSGGIVGLTERFLLRVVPKKKQFAVSRFFAKRGRRWNDKTAAYIVFPITIGECRRYYPADLFDHLQKTEFQGKYYSACTKADEFLTLRYGDYMQYPPEEERVWKHPPLLLDLTRNYEELPNEEKVFDNHSGL